MNTFEFYIHGTPNGLQIWGSDKNHDYINTFYNHDVTVPEKSCMQIDIYMQNSFYTYIRQQNVFDSNDRPGSFFAMTISFNKAYCTNVFLLFQLFDQVYNRFCIGSIIAQEQNKESYLVSDFESAHSNNLLTVDKIRDVFINNIEGVMAPSIQSIDNLVDTIKKPKRQFSLKDVDSPLFVDSFKEFSITVLPKLESAIVVKQELSKQLNDAKELEKNLRGTINQQTSEIETLKKENEGLGHKLQASESSSKQKYSAEIDRLKAELEKSKRSCERLTKERDENKDKVEKMERSIKNIDESYQEFTRQLAGRFPNNPKEVNKMRRENFYEDVQEDFSDSQTDSSKDTRKSWHLWINTILLGLVLVCVSLVLALTLTTSGILVKDKNKTREVVEKLEDPVETSTLESDQESYENASESENLIAAEDSADKIEYDDAESCRIDIKGLKASTLVPGTEYKLSIKRIKGGEQAVVPNGTWKVKIEPSTLLNNQDVFKVSQEFSGDSVQIQYIGEGGFFLSRIIKVK